MRRTNLLALILLTVALHQGRAAPAAIDRLPALLADDWTAERRDLVREQVRALGGAACATLSGYAAAVDPRAREHAVRAMDDAGCDSAIDYSPFFRDSSAWVIDALIETVGRRRMAAATPFLIASLADHRDLISDDGTVNLMRAADRALRRVTAQPIPPDPPADLEARWRAWHAAHAADGQAAWIESGLGAIRKGLDGGDPRARLTALQTLALLGEPGGDLLAHVLHRRAGDLQVTVTCQPDEPPRVVDEVPCTLFARNVSEGRIALAPGEVHVSLDLRSPGTPAGRHDGRHESTDLSSPDLPAIAEHLLDLAPGETLRRDFRAGPVPAAGRYDVRATVTDFARPLLAAPPGDDPGPIEAETMVRYEQ
jgi:hypothetical protein